MTHEHNKQVNSAIDSIHKSNLLTEKAANMLKTNDLKTPKFYTLPKIHKENACADLEERQITDGVFSKNNVSFYRKVRSPFVLLCRTSRSTSVTIQVDQSLAQ